MAEKRILTTLVRILTTDAEDEEDREQPVQQAGYPVTAPQRKRGRPKKTAM